MHKLLQIDGDTSTLIGVGSSICGGSAIADAGEEGREGSGKLPAEKCRSYIPSVVYLRICDYYPLHVLRPVIGSIPATERVEQIFDHHGHGGHRIEQQRSQVGKERWQTHAIRGLLLEWHYGR